MTNPHTLLPRFYGLCRVKPHKGEQVRFVVMANVFQTPKKVHERYDLKGTSSALLPNPLKQVSILLTSVFNAPPT